MRWIRLESSLWETSSLLLVDGNRAVAIDPGVLPDEIAAVAERARDEKVTVEHVLATHSDWDHVVGIAAFPDAVASMSPAAAANVSDGGAQQAIEEAGAEQGVRWEGAPRVDRIVEPGRAFVAGPFLVETLPTPGHTDCGLAFRVRALDLLAVGDYLSPREFPFVYESTAHYRATLALLLDTLRSDPPATVIAGHGPPLTAAEALAIAESDLAYMHALRAAVARAVGAGASPDDAVEAGAAVEPPRAGADDTGELRRNSELQLAELSVAEAGEASLAPTPTA